MFVSAWNLKLVTPLLVAFIAVGCGEDDEDSKAKVRFVPELTPIFDRSTPASFKPSTGAGLTQATLTAATNLAYFFQRDASSPFTGERRVGVVRGAIEDVDSRMVQFSLDEGAEPPKCIGETPATSNFTATTGNGHELAMKFGCYSPFEGAGDKAGAGSGAAYGADETKHYLGIILTQQADPENQRFGFFATIDKTTSAIDFLFLDDFQNRRSFFRIKAVPDSTNFEYSGAGVVVGYGPDNNYSGVAAPFLTFQGGSRMISNATHVLVQGKACGTDATGACQTAPVELNLPVSTLDYTTAGSCFEAASFAAQADLTNCSSLTFSADMTLVPSTGFADAANVAKLKSSLRFDSLTTLTRWGN